LVTLANRIDYCNATALYITANKALRRPAVQISTDNDAVASHAVDEYVTTYSCTLEATQPWWSIDLGTPMSVGRVEVTNDRRHSYG